MPNEFEQLLDEFAADSAVAKHAAFRRLIALRQHHKAVDDNRFKTGLDNLLVLASDPMTKELDRLLAIATLGRIASTIRGIRSKIQEALVNVLETQFPDPSILDDVDDRAYIGQVCTIGSQSWLSDYAARAVVSEESGEQARQAFLAALVKSIPDLETSLGTLADYLKVWIPETDEPGNSASRRLRRILVSLRAVIAEVMPEPGEDPGAALAKVVNASYSGISAPTSIEALADTADEVAGVVHEMVRLRFSLVTNASTYSALNAIQEVIPTQKWQKIAQSSKMMAMVASDIAEAILVLARQGVTDSDLVRQLGTASGGSSFSRVLLREVAKKSGLSPEVRTWLAEGRLEAPKKISPDAGESRKLSDDALIADLLVDACRFRIFEQSGRQQILPEFEVLNPTLANEVSRLLNYSLGLCDAIALISKRRGLRVRGLPFDEEDYSPLDHEVVGETVGVRRVRIIRPVVEQVRDDGIPYVLRKGLVEPLK